jgi:histidine triad (HIT) family protein
MSKPTFTAGTETGTFQYSNREDYKKLRDDLKCQFRSTMTEFFRERSETRNFSLESDDVEIRLEADRRLLVESKTFWKTATEYSDENDPLSFGASERALIEEYMPVPVEQQSKTSQLILNLMFKISWLFCKLGAILLKIFGFLDENILDENCKFCNIIRDEKEAVTKIYHGPWDKEVLVIQPINPASEGHILVIPRTHVTDSRPAKVFARTAFWASKVAETLYPNAHINFQANQGKFSGQTINHLHFHDVIRRENDELPQFWDGQIDGHYNTRDKPEHPEHVKSKRL